MPLVVLVSESRPITASTGRCEPWAGEALAWSASRPMSSTKCVWIRFKTTKIQQCSKHGQQILAVVGSACTTSAGAYDPLEDIAQICQEHKIWFHVDGAHGASAAFSDTHRHLVAGMERADSVVLDFHKTCGIPALCTGVFYADKNDSYLPSLNTQSTSGTTPMRPIGGTRGNAPLNAPNAC